MDSTLRRLRLALGLLVAISVLGTLGYWALGMSLLDASYQTIINVTTVGFRELSDFSDVEKIFTMIIIVFGVATALYSLTLAMQVLRRDCALPRACMRSSTARRSETATRS